MKKILLFTTVTLSMNLFAQNKQPESIKQYPTSNSMDEVLGKIEVIEGLNKSNIRSETNSKRVIKLQHRQTRSLYQINDSIYNWDWDTGIIGWAVNPYQKTINIIYDANNNQIGNLIQNWNGSTWVNYQQYAFSYDANNNLTSNLRQSWNINSWENSSLSTFTYNANNNQTNVLQQIWNGSVWVNGTQYIFNYDANNNKMGQLSQNWNGSVWENTYQYTFTYDSNNNQTSELKQSWNGSTWTNTNLYTDTYTNNNLTTVLSQSWNGSNWENTNQFIITFDTNNNRTGSLQQTWNGNNWGSTSQNILTYDSNNNMTSELHQNWNSSIWENAMLFTHTYDSNNFTKSNAHKYWNNGGIQIISGDSTYFYFHSVTNINDLLSNDKGILIAPNPFSSQTTISFTKEQRNTIIKIMDILGSDIKTVNLSGKELKIEMGEMKAGIYFIQIMDENKIVVNRKIIIQ